MSEQSRDDKELQEFLAGDSALSRRYKQLSDDQPPAHVDAAILASARWAVGADRKPTGEHRSGSEQTGTEQTGTEQTAKQQTRSEKTAPEQIVSAQQRPRPTGSVHATTRRRRSPFMRWGVPLATAAVVVVAASLTLMIERDPAIERIYERYDAPSQQAELQQKEEDADAPVRQETPAPAKQAQPPATEPAPASPSPPVRAPAVPSPAREESVAQRSAPEKPLTQTPVTRRTEPPAEPAAPTEQQRLARQAADAEKATAPAPASVAADAPAVAEPAAEAFPGSSAGDTDNVGSAEDADDSGSGFGAPRDEMSAPTTGEAAQPTEFSQAGETASAGRAAEPAASALAPQPLAESESTAQFAESQGAGDPDEWIEQIEELLSAGRRDEAIASLREFRRDYPDYPLPAALLPLLEEINN